LRAVGKQLNRLRQLARDDVRQRDGLEHRPLVRAQRDPHPLQRLGRAGVGDILRPLATHAEQLPVDRPDDIRERDLVRGPRQPETAVRAALAAHQAAAPQVRQDRLEELAGNVLREGELLRRDMAVFRGGEFDGRAERVIGTCRQSHACNYAASRPVF
jgi:hypothetical protein